MPRHIHPHTPPTGAPVISPGISANGGLSAAAGDRRWLFGPVPDIALGCGTAYVIAFAVLALAGESIRSAVPIWKVLVLFNLISGAHYGATAVRAYARSDDRRAYALFTLWTTILLGAGFVAGLASYTFGSWVITTYLTWSPWHYAGQNFGVAMMFLRRRGVAPTTLARRLLHTSFVASYILSAVALHFTDRRIAYAPAQIEDTVYSFLQLGHVLGTGPEFGDWAILVAIVVYVATTAGAVILLKRAGTWRDLGPTLALVATQALWFSIPVLARHYGVMPSLDPLSPAADAAQFAFLWIGFGHVFQYLWITTYFAKESGRSKSKSGFLVRSLLAGTALWWIPALLFAPGLLGRLPYDAGLAMMVAALVNLHHFVLDGVIWKLRDARIAGVLVRRETGAKRDDAPRGMRPALQAVLWVGGIATLAIGTASTAITAFGFNDAYLRGDIAAARRASEVLEGIGQASAEQRLKLGNAALAAGDLDDARRDFERSVEIFETAWAWTGIGEVCHRSEDLPGAADAYAKAMRLDPAHAVATFYAAVVALETGQRERGRRLLMRARTLAAADPNADPELIPRIEGVLAETAER